MEVNDVNLRREKSRQSDVAMSVWYVYRRLRTPSGVHPVELVDRKQTYHGNTASAYHVRSNGAFLQNTLLGPAKGRAMVRYAYVQYIYVISLHYCI